MNTANLHSPKTPQAERGISLIELMIAMALGLVITATIGYAFLGASGSFRAQNATSTIQENARYAFEFMGTDIRMAGFTGGPTDSTVTQPVGWADQRDLKDFPLRGVDEGNGIARLRGDALTVVHVDTDNEYKLDAANATTFTLNSWPSSAPAVGGLFVGADYTHAAAFAVTAVNSGARTLTTSNDLSGFTGAIAARRVFPLNGVTYYIANNPAGEPSLYRLKLNSAGTTTAEELVEGVQNMEITYGVDYTAPSDHSVDAYWTATEVESGTAGGNTIPGTASPTNYWSHVLSVRATLILTTKSTERISTTGGLLTKTFSTTFAVRNRL